MEQRERKRKRKGKRKGDDGKERERVSEKTEIIKAVWGP